MCSAASAPSCATDVPRTVGVDVGGTKLLAVVLDGTEGGAAPQGVARRPTPRGAPALVDSLVGVVADALAAAGGTAPDAVGLGLPGLVDLGGVLRIGPNLPGVIDLEVERSLGDALGVPVRVENDANCAAWAEHRWGASQRHDHALLVTLGTGIGAGIIVDGRLHRGAHGMAGEPGHMIVDPRGPQCPCGQRGCWERFASGTGLGQLGREAALAGRGDALVELAGGDAEGVRGEHVTAAARAGDAGALAVLDGFGWWVALGVANLVNVLDPQIVVVGGGLAADADLFLDAARAAYADLVLGHGHRPAVPLVAAETGEQAGALGAALLAAERGWGPEDPTR